MLISKLVSQRAGMSARWNSDNQTSYLGYDYFERFLELLQWRMGQNSDLLGLDRRHIDWGIALLTAILKLTRLRENILDLRLLWLVFNPEAKWGKDARNLFAFGKAIFQQVLSINTEWVQYICSYILIWKMTVCVTVCAHACEIFCGRVCPCVSSWFQQ